MRKKIIIGSMIVVLIVACVLGLTQNFTKGVLSKRVYFPDNVFDEIWNLTVSESRGNKTILTTSAEDAEVDFDFGVEFVGVYFRKLDASVHLASNKDLKLYLWQEEGDPIVFVYDCESKTLYSEEDVACITENFLNHYFDRYNRDSKFSSSDLGKFTYKNENPYNYLYQ